VSEHPKAPERRSIDVDVQSLDTRGRTLHGYAAVYNVESGDLGGWTEKIAPGAFAGVMDADVRALLNHDANQVLGRSKSGTLRLADEERGLRFEIDLPDSPLGQNVREAVGRGDIDGASFRFVVGEEEWQDEVRTVTAIKELHDVTVATYGAYPAASVELRTRPNNEPAPEAEKESTVEIEDRQTDGGLAVEDRVAATPARHKGLYAEFRTRGFPGERAEVSWQEYEDRALTWTPSINLVNQVDRQAVPLGFDQRYGFPALGMVAVDSGVTSVIVATQTARSLATAANVVRNIDAIVAKPESSSTVDLVTVPMKQVANVSGAIANVYLENAALQSIIEGDLRLALNEGFDKVFLDTLTASGFQAPGTDTFIASVRKAMTTLMAAGYSPDTLIITPAAAEQLDLLVSGISGGTADYVFAPGQPAPNIWNLTRRVSKTVPASVVMDSTAYGKFYASPASLAAFEQDGGTTNRSLLRLEGHAACGVERQTAAIRIAAA